MKNELQREEDKKMYSVILLNTRIQYNQSFFKNLFRWLILFICFGIFILVEEAEILQQQTKGR